MHSDIDTVERVEIIRDLRKGTFDVLIGINLLREGLDIPEVSLVAILDADKEGFLRSARSLVQTIGRAARNLNGRVILYADRITTAIQYALDETDRRREKQEAFNTEHGITPRSIVKPVKDIIEGITANDSAWNELPEMQEVAEDREEYSKLSPKELGKLLGKLEKEMYEAARNLEFEAAAGIRGSDQEDS